jgi:hypothetical protein
MLHFSLILAVRSSFAFFDIRLMIFFARLSAVYFEQGNYEKAIETCEKAVNEGRSVGSYFLLFLSLVTLTVRSRCEQTTS